MYFKKILDVNFLIKSFSRHQWLIKFDSMMDVNLSINGKWVYKTLSFLCSFIIVFKIGSVRFLSLWVHVIDFLSNSLMGSKVRSDPLNNDYALWTNWGHKTAFLIVLQGLPEQGGHHYIALHKKARLSVYHCNSEINLTWLTQLIHELRHHNDPMESLTNAKWA